MNNITAHITFVTEEYNKLYNENTQLKIKIMELYKNEEILKETIANNKLTIENLIAENTMLKNKIYELENKVSYILEENKQIKEENKQLIKDVSNLQNKMIKMDNKNYINKVIFACQDLNSCELLENNFKIPFNKLINKLRLNRNEECHYIFKDESNDIILSKEKALCDILENLDYDRRLLLNKKIGTSLVDEIIKFLKNQPFDITKC